VQQSLLDNVSLHLFLGETNGKVDVVAVQKFLNLLFFDWWWPVVWGGTK
jgi:hypothetical protein